MAEELKIEEQIQNPVDKTKVLYDAVSKDYNIGSYDEFSKKLKDPTKRKAFYEGVGSEYNLGTFEDFSNKIGVTSLKKKELSLPSGEISSLTELPSEFIEPLKKGVNPNPTKEEQKLAKMLGVTPSKGMVMPTNLPKQEAISYQKQLKVKEGAINTLDNLYKSKGLKFNPNSKRGQEQVQEYINKEKDNDLGLVQGTHDQKPYLTRTAGLGESFVNSLVSSLKEPVESFKINMTSSPSELADLLDQKAKEQPNVPESIPSKFGGYYGQLAGGLPKMLGELAIPYVGGSVMAGEMYHNSIANQRASLYQKGIEEGLSREESAKKAMEAAPVTAIPEAAMGAFLARGGGEAQILKEGTKNAFKEAAVNFAKSVPTMAALGGGAELGRGVAEYAQGYKVDPTKMVENALQAGGEWGLMDAAFKIVHASKYVPKYLVSAAKNVLSEVPKPILEAEASKYETKDKIINDVDNFAKTKEEVKKVVPVTDEKVASVTGITEKIQNLEKNIQDLNEQKKTTPEALHPYIDEWVKEYQDEADSYKNKMNKIVESKDLTGMNEEVDDVTGVKASEVPRFSQEPVISEEPQKVYNAQSEIENIATKLSKDDFLNKTHVLPLEGLDPGFSEEVKKKVLSRKSRTPDAPIRLGFEDGKVKILDGAHRYYEAVERGDKTIKANFAYGEGADKFYDDIIKSQENAIQESSAESILQYPQEGVGETGGERQRVEPSIEGVTPAEEVKQVKVNEKSEEKGLSIKGLRASETRKLNEEANKIEASDARSAALKYLTGGNLSWDAIKEVAGSVKRGSLNTGARELKTEEIKSRDYTAKQGEGQSLDEAAHAIWEDVSKKNPNIDITDVKNELMNAVLEHKTKSEAAKALIDGYKEESPEEQMNKYYEQLAGENKDLFEEELAMLEDTLSKDTDDNLYEDVPEEHIQNLINQYEAEYQTKSKLTTEGSKGEVIEKISRGTGGEETKTEPEKLITIAANAEMRNQLGMDDYKRNKETFGEWYEKAQDEINKGYTINKLIDKMNDPNEILSPVENTISKIYKLSLSKLIEKDPSDANLQLAKTFIEARDIANGKLGASFRSLQDESPEIAELKTLADFYVDKMEDNGVDVLTEAQKKEVKGDYEKLKAKLDIIEQKNAELEKLNSELLAQKEFGKTKETKKPKAKRDFTAERKEVIDSIKDKLKKARTGESGLTAVPVPYAKELAAIAPDVAKLMKLYVEEGVEKLDDVVSKIYDVLKDEIDGVNKNDIKDVIAGKYAKKTNPRSAAERKVQDLRTEAKLANEILEVKKGKVKTEKEEVQKNKKITELRKELNNLRKETGYYDESKLKAIVKRTVIETRNIQEKIEKGEYDIEKPKSFIENPELKKKYSKLYEQYLDAIDAKDAQMHEYEMKRAEDQMNSLDRWDKRKAQATQLGKETLNTVKAVKAGIDNSAVFVQNGIAVLNPMNINATKKALIAQTKDALSEASFRRRIIEVHENKALWRMIEESGLDYLDPRGYSKSLREEQFGGRTLLERVKIGEKDLSKYTTAPFERLFTSFSNEFRLQLFLKGADVLLKEGKTIDSNPKEYQDLASYVNNITGRGKLKKSLQPAENAISTVIWAPKLLSSTLNLVGIGDLGNLGKNKGYYRDMTPKMRKYAITQTAAGIGTGVALMSAYALMPNKEVDWDPTSVTFGQVTDTKTGWGVNIFGRLTPIVRYLAMMTTLTKKVGTGKASKVEPLKETYKFIRGKMNPIAGITSDVIMRKDFSGKPYKLSNVPSDLFEPLYINDLRKQLEVDGVSSVLTMGIPAFYGLKVANQKQYDKRDLESLLDTIDSSTMSKSSLFNYNESRDVTDKEFDEFVKQRDSLLKEYYTNISKNGVPVKDQNGEVSVLPIDSKELTKDQLTLEINRLKRLATEEVKKELFGKKVIEEEEKEANKQLGEIRKEQGIGKKQEE